NNTGRRNSGPSDVRIQRTDSLFVSKTAQNQCAASAYTYFMNNRVDIFTSSEPVPRSGLYRVSHTKHPIRDIKLLKGRRFPACPECSGALQFDLIESLLVESASERFRFLVAGESQPELKSA